MNPDELCKRVIDSDHTIRFAAIAALDGNIVALRYRIAVEPQLTEEESRLSLMQSLMKAAIRRTFENKLGKTVYATAVYEKVKRATISMFDTHIGKGEGLLMISVEKEGDLESLITNKILPMVENY
jgi:hypothetical protein